MVNPINLTLASVDHGDLSGSWLHPAGFTNLMVTGDPSQ